MNHQVSRGKVCKGVQLLPVGGRFLRFTPGFPFGDELPLGENGDLGHGILHAVGQRSLGKENLTGLWEGRQGNGKKRRQSFLPKHLLKKLRPAAGAAEHQGAKFHFLIVAEVCRGSIHAAAVAGQLLGGHGKQQLWHTVSGIGGTGESVKINGAPSPKLSAEVLPLAAVVAQLPGGKAGL